MNLVQRILATSLILLPFTIGCEQDKPKVPPVPVAPPIEYSEPAPTEKPDEKPTVATPKATAPAVDPFRYWITPEDFSYTDDVREKIIDIRSVGAKKAVENLSDDAKAGYNLFTSGRDVQIPYYALVPNEETGKVDIVLRNGIRTPQSASVLENEVIVSGFTEVDLLEELRQEYNKGLPTHPMNVVNPMSMDQLMMFFYERFRENAEFDIYSSSGYPIQTIPFYIEIPREGKTPIPIKFAETTLEIESYRMLWAPNNEDEAFYFHDARKAGRFLLDGKGSRISLQQAQRTVTDYTLKHWTSFDHSNWRRYTSEGQEDLETAFGDNGPALMQRWKPEIDKRVGEFIYSPKFEQRLKENTY